MDGGTGYGAVGARGCPGERVAGQFFAFAPFGPGLGFRGKDNNRSSGHVLLVQELFDGGFDGCAFFLVASDLDLNGSSAFRSDGRAFRSAAVGFHNLGMNLLGVTAILAQQEWLLFNGEFEASGVDVLVVVAKDV